MRCEVLHSPSPGCPVHPRAPLAMKSVQEVAPVLIPEKFDDVLDQGCTAVATTCIAPPASRMVNVLPVIS
jgi:hypothetical protein